MSSDLEQSPEKEGEWTDRSENLQTDLLRLFERSEFHDCTFLVTSEDGKEIVKKISMPIFSY